MEESFIYRHRRVLKILFDTVCWSILTPITFALRLEEGVIGYESQILLTTLVLIPFKFLFIYIFGHLNRSWQYSSVKDLLNLGKTIGLFTIIYFVGDLLLREFSAFYIPRSVPLIEGTLAILFLGGARFLVRVVFKERFISSSKKNKNKRVIIAGAGDAGAMIAREMFRHSESGLTPVAFVDDAVAKWNSNIMGVPVAGRTNELCTIAKEYKADELIIAMPSESGNVIRRIVELARSCELPHRIIPGLYDLISGRVGINQLRNVDLEDLLRRKPVNLDTQKIQNYIEGKRVLVTGAGGSIGSEIVRQITKFNPEYIILLGRGENSIHQLVREMNENFSSTKIIIRITDVRDRVSLEKIFIEHQPEVIFHAAAHKHVPLMEENPSQAIFNNVGGTKNVVDLAVEYKVGYLVNISTDKAVNPTSVMGASKRIAEYIVQEGSDRAGKNHNFVSVRFGNVLGSRGSVIPIFRDQIRRGGPICITHPDMIRYFMTIPEASQLVLQAGALKETGAVFVLDMGEPVKIVDMARDLIRLSGLEPDKDIEIKITGMREGEKLYEELLTAEEGTSMTQYEKIMMAKKSTGPKTLDKKLEDLFNVAESGDSFAIKEMIHILVPSYTGINKEEV